MHFRIALQSHLNRAIAKIPFCSFRLLALICVPVAYEVVLQAATSSPAFSVAQSSEAKTAQEITVLELNRPIQRELSGGQKHSYQIAISVEQYVKIEIKPQNIDIGASLQGPNGKIITRIGHPYGV